MTDELRPYQNEAIDFMLDAERVILADPPGVGKTATAAVWAAETGRLKTLFVVPRAVRLHWQREIERWIGEGAVIYDGTSKQREKILAAKPEWVITHYERFRIDYESFMDEGFATIVFDEAHRLKNRKAQVTKAAYKVTRRVPSVALLTGTPILNRAEELWSLLHILAPKTYTSFWRWAGEHFDVTQEWLSGRMVYRVGELREGHAETLRDANAGILLQRPIEQLLPDLPDVQESVIEVELGPAERREYDRLVKFGWADLPDGTVLSASNVLALSTRLRQFTSDWTALCDGIDELGSPSAKVAAAVEVITDLEPEQVVVLTAFKHTARAVGRALGKAGISTRLHTGDQPSKFREAALRDFQRGDARVIIGTIATMGEGVDGLQCARHILFMDRDWTPARNEQALGRVRRSGQTATKVVAWRIVARDTIDQTIEAALASKQSVIDSLKGKSLSEIVGGK